MRVLLEQLSFCELFGDMVKNARNQKLSPSDVRRYLGGLANKLIDNSPLRDDERTFLANCLGCISAGESADEVFGLKRGPGQKQADVERRRRWSLILWWIEAAIRPISEEGKGYSRTKAFEKAHELFQNADGIPDVSEIKEAWYNSAYEHMRSPVRTPFDPDSPIDKL